MEQNIPRKVVTGWEQRLPSLGGTWTHWVLIGGGNTRLGVSPGTDVSGVLKVVAENFQKFDHIKAARAFITSDGLFSEEKALFEISRFESDQRALDNGQNV